MALDAAMISITAKELDNTLVGARVEKIYMPSRDEAVFSLRTMKERCSLFLSARSGSARVHITNEQFEYPAVPPAFCMLLRKHLLGAKITSVKTVPDDRVILIYFDSINEMGDRVFPFLSIEMMGRYSNIVLVNGEGRVLDAVKRIDESQSDKRQLGPGEEFTYPPVPENKIPFLSSSAEEIVSELCKSTKTTASALLSCVSGLSPLLCRETAGDLDDVRADFLSGEQKNLLLSNIQNIKDAVENPEKRFYSIVYDGEKPVEFSFVPLRQYGDLKTVVFSSPGELFDAFYGDRDRNERMKTRSMDLTRQVKQLIERNRRKQEARTEELEATSKADEKKLCGELLTANLHAFKRGDKSVTVLNYYDGTNKTIPLDVTKNPVDNAQKYYRDYRKLHTAAEVLKDLLEEGEREYEYLQAVKYEISEAKTEEEFLDIRSELKNAGYLKGSKMKERSKRKSEPYLHYLSSSGLEIIVGRNNAANEKLSLKLAGARDIWCHVKNAAGSHVLLKTEGITPDDKSITEACEIAALHSELTSGSSVEVDYTEARKVKKLTGGKSGMVTYTGQRTAFVIADREKLEKLKR